MSDQFETLLSFFKALGNESRLKIVAILAEEECSVRELAERLNLKEPTVSEHLALLKEAGLVKMRSEGNFRYYSFDAQALYEMNRSLLNPQQLAALVKDDAEDERQVLESFVKGDKLVAIPARRKKLLVILRWLVDKFEFGRTYTEQEVNAIIKRYHEDSATLRREFIGHKLMQRDRGVYWRISPQDSDGKAAS
jgi:hypothetical protein